MYIDPSQIRDNSVRINLNDAEKLLLDAIVAYSGGQRATVLRNLLLEHAGNVLGVEMNSPLMLNGNEGLTTRQVGH